MARTFSRESNGGGVVGVRFRNSRRMYFCRAGEDNLQPGDFAVVTTSAGAELGKVVLGAAAGASDILTAGREIVRRATAADLDSLQRALQGEFAAQVQFLSSATAAGIDVCAVRANYSFDGSRVTFRFRASGPADRAELRRRLGEEFSPRVVLRQLSSPAQPPTGGCGDGGCATCPSNGMRERAGAALPSAGMAPAGAFAGG
ncbi:MAG TPA: PSP1 C-terminal domain-containing protein [Chloroflexota bacterium]|nr:PSP1 C-terminal domain-containing protein [Chloroflexota bacterium]